MHDPGDVERTLATIRRLMERGRHYEAISARGALLAGLAAFLASAALYRFAPESNAAFLGTWAAVALGAASWTAFSAVGSARGGTDERGLTAQARSVLMAVLPAYAVAGVLTAVLARGHADLLPPTWMLLHGTAILATRYHAPERLVRLGVAFLAAGTLFAFVDVDRHVEMAASFGLINLVHAALAWGRSAQAD